MTAGTSEMRSWPCGYLGCSVWSEPDDVSWGIVVADPDLALRFRATAQPTARVLAQTICV